MTAIIKQMTVLLHASLDPYNTTEEMEITWNNMALDWTSGSLPNFLYKIDGIRDTDKPT